MPFSSGDSVAAADLNNVLRGLYQDNTSRAVTGTTAETDMASTSITGGTITGTGAIHVIAAGTVTNSASAAKDIRLYFGATAVATVSRTGANAQDWIIDAWCYNTATNAQRWNILYSTTDATTVTADHTTSAIDTTAAVTCKVTGDLTNTADTITGTMFAIYVVQIA